MTRIKQGPAPEDHYTLIPNSLARSNEIPARAKVVYIYLKSHRDGWDITTERVAEALGMSKNTVSRALQDLEEWGFVVRSQERGEGGAFAGWEYTVLSPASTVSQKLGNGDAPHPKKPASQKTRIPEIGTHKKTNSSKKTIFEEDPPVVPRRGTGAGVVVSALVTEPAAASSGYPPAFEAWWADYPKKTGKGDAFRKWKAANKKLSADELHARLLDRLPGLLATQQRNPRFVPNPATWLNQARYDDPVEEPQQPVSQQGQRRQSILDAANQLMAEEATNGQRQIS
jgi:DNA-binding transcriptional ArsR family regulator